MKIARIFGVDLKNPLDVSRSLWLLIRRYNFKWRIFGHCRLSDARNSIALHIRDYSRVRAHLRSQTLWYRCRKHYAIANWWAGQAYQHARRTTTRVHYCYSRPHEQPRHDTHLLAGGISQILPSYCNSDTSI